MQFVGGGLEILRPERRDNDIIKQVDNCLFQLQDFSGRNELQDSDFYKFNLFINVDFRDNCELLKQEIRAKIRAVYGNVPMVVMLAQQPVDHDLIMEASYYDASAWTLTKINNSQGEAIVFEKAGTKVTSGHSGSEKITGCYKQSKAAFAGLSELLEEAGQDMSDIVRQWNYIEDILGYDGPCQHYQLFNDARSDAYGEHFKKNGFPAATGISMDCGGVIIAFTAVSGKSFFSKAIDNPRQVPAYKYDESYLMGEAIDCSKTTPKFERGRYLSVFSEQSVLISGTAAIAGQQVMHKGDTRLQTLFTIENIKELISGENRSRLGIPEGELEFTYIRTYIKEIADMFLVRELCKEMIGDVPSVFIKADVCRDDLLVEIEAVANLRSK